MRTGVKQMLQDFNAQHALTLAFHEPCLSLQRAESKISKWHFRMMHRLFGRQFAQLPSNRLIEFLLVPEGGIANLHYHGLIRIPNSHLAYFQRIALNRWRSVARKGTLCLLPIGPTSEDQTRLFSYITKGALISEVLHSSMLMPPPSPT